MALSISKAWDEARTSLAANRRLITPVALGLILVPAVVSSMVEPRTAPGEQPEAGPWMWITLAMIIIMLTGQLALVLLTNGWQGSVGEAIKRALRRLPTLLISAMIVMVPLIVILTALLVIVGVGTGGDGRFSMASMSPTGWLVFFAGILILFVVAVRLLPLVVVTAAEDVGPIAAVRRSFALTAGHFWKLLGFVLLATIAFLVVAAAAGAVIGSIVALLFGRPEPWTVSLLLVALTAGLVQAAFVTFYTAMLARIAAQLNAGRPSVPDVEHKD